MQQVHPDRLIRPHSQETHSILWNLQVQYHVYIGPSLVPVFSQMYLVHDLPPQYFKIHCNIILPSTPMSSKWLLSFRFPRFMKYTNE